MCCVCVVCCVCIVYVCIMYCMCGLCVCMCLCIVYVRVCLVRVFVYCLCVLCACTHKGADTHMHVSAQVEVRVFSGVHFLLSCIPGTELRPSDLHKSLFQLRHLRAL